ncbi:MAG TPA: sporulation protein, partial [Chondromyces sp.]|nr:sporulation protein [Chondromyces sp.]
MFKKIMAKIGVGSAKIDLILPQSAYMMGDTVAGELVIQGGAVDQSINKIDIDFIIQIHTSKQIHQQVIQKIPFPEAFTIHASERKALPFSFTIPQDVLVSGSKVSYLFKTNLDIAGGIDSGDHDPIQILPPKRLDHLISAFEELGFRESHDSRSFDGYTQEFEFFPTSFLRGQVNEVEFAAALEEDQIRVLL